MGKWLNSSRKQNIYSAWNVNEVLERDKTGWWSDNSTLKRRKKAFIPWKHDKTEDEKETYDFKYLQVVYVF